MTVLAFPGTQRASLSIGGIPLLILATQDAQCVGKSGGISPVKKIPLVLYPKGPQTRTAR
jgi:hypothetical protein